MFGKWGMRRNRIHTMVRKRAEDTDTSDIYIARPNDCIVKVGRRRIYGPFAYGPFAAGCNNDTPVTPVLGLDSYPPHSWRSQIPLEIRNSIRSYKSPCLQFADYCAFDLGSYELCAVATHVQLSRCSNIDNVQWRIAFFIRIRENRHP